METKNRPSFIKHIKLVIAFSCGIFVNILYAFKVHPPQGASAIIIPGVMVLFLFFCFNMYKNVIRNISKLGFIDISAVCGVYFSPKYVSLILFELVTEKNNGKDYSQDGK